MLSNEYVLSIDPGRNKIGVAQVGADGGIVSAEVVSVEELAQVLTVYAQPSQLVIGNGTNSKAINKVLKQVFPQLTAYIIEESYSTEEARSLYWQVNPPTGLRKLIPLGLQTPPIPLDGYAAVVLARRYLAQRKDE